MKLNIKKIVGSLMFLFIVPLSPDIPLATIGPTATPTPTIMPIKLKPNILGKIKSVVGKRGWVEKGTVTAISGATLTVTKDGVIYTVDTDSNTSYKRKFGGKGSFDEIKVNNVVNVLGKWQNEEKTQILATHIRNLSIQKRFAVFFGTVKSKTDSTLVLTTVNRGEQTITIDSSTKLVNRKMEEIKLEDIQIGHRIRIKGTWDISNKQVMEVAQIKDFSIPVVSSPTPKATN